MIRWLGQLRLFRSGLEPTNYGWARTAFCLCCVWIIVGHHKKAVSLSTQCIERSFAFLLLQLSALPIRKYQNKTICSFISWNKPWLDARSYVAVTGFGGSFRNRREREKCNQLAGEFIRSLVSALPMMQIATWLVMDRSLCLFFLLRGAADCRQSYLYANRSSRKHIQVSPTVVNNIMIS